MLRYEIRTAGDLSPTDAIAWTQLLLDGNPAPSPYLTPDYFHAVAKVRPTARVLIARAGGDPVLFFPHHLGGLTGAFGLGHPIGGPVTDVQGVIARSGCRIDRQSLMRAAGICLLPMAHVPAADPVFQGEAHPHAFHVMDFSDGFAAYETARTPFAKSAFRAIRTRAAKATEQYGSVTLRFDDADPASFKDLLSWKRAQFVATGQTNVLEVAWVAALVHDLLASRSGLRAQMSSLWFGERRVAVHLGLRTETTLHYWFPAYDASVQELSPGNLLLYQMAAAAAREGVRQIHLGAGEYRYKQEFANCTMPMRGVVATASTLPGRVAQGGQKFVAALGRRLPKAVATMPAGAFRRLDRHLAFRDL